MNIQTEPTHEEVAAALAAVHAYLSEEAPGEQPLHAARRSRWADSAKLAVQGLQPTRTVTAPRWAVIERLRRQWNRSYGFTGL